MRAILFTGMFAVWCCASAEAREVLRVGEGGQISWEGVVGAGIAVETIEPEYRSTLDPNITELGVAPVNLVDFASLDFPESIMPRQGQEGQNIA